MKRSSRSSSAGFTLLEATIATTIFGMVGYGLAVAIGAGQDTQQSILTNSISNKELRQTALQVSAELRSCASTNFEVTEGQTGHSQIDFQMPISSAGSLTWGVYDKRLGQESEDQNRVGWSVRYIVEEDAGAFGLESPAGEFGAGRRLVRQLLDDEDEVQLSESVVEGLNSGYGAHPGFAVSAAGDMWTVTINLAGQEENTNGNQVEFDVWMHN